MTADTKLFTIVIFFLLKMVRFKGSRELTDSDKFEISRRDDTYTLIVHNVFGEDADEYCIKATTPAGSRSSRADLIIRSEWGLCVASVYFPPV